MRRACSQSLCQLTCAHHLKIEDFCCHTAAFVIPSTDRSLLLELVFPPTSLTNIMLLPGSSASLARSVW